ncbi:XRE family transcriptional regulator [Clostridium botulinum]|uniref:helix-turn-helix domain-containing protein n=1 Tax=Clostridium botulinum TaxID=1491 RepID=UPI000A175E5E|nr:helix-turn-helix transcriptional regulator [Clostridium botulinum]AUN09807.1 XRE family transcriptional regulator [Clostridium botulinum]AUN20851.1 XRE family transcriptional regulator [Clostridium botulinum]AUN24635.1 XRE family transcriptional regulator [Clostridium botulinum]OSA72960.1 XRE family transcriptional regulator [Clostridium botulinum]QDY20261.1 XRE family transcriptional regulator [Clostridium botulinum]
MNRLNIGETILQLRKAKNLTQEQLASMVGVSAGAVSKWENGNSTPDISLLGPLVRALDTSLDILLSFQPQLSEIEVDDIKQELIKIFLHGGYAAGEAKSLQYLNEYANSIRLKYEVAGLIYMYLMMAEKPSEEFIKSKKMYSLALLQQVVKSRDPKYTPMALFSIAHIHMEMEDYEESEKALKELPLYPIDPAIIYVDLYFKQEKDNEAIELCSSKLLNYITHSCAILTMLSKISKEKQNYDKAIFYLDACYKLQKIFKIGLGSAAYNYSKLYIEINKKEAAAQWFKTYVEEILAVQYDHHSNPYFEKIKLEVATEDQKMIRKKMLKSIIDEEDFKVLTGIADYEKGINELTDAVFKM